MIFHSKSSEKGFGSKRVINCIAHFLFSNAALFLLACKKCENNSSVAFKICKFNPELEKKCFVGEYCEIIL